MAFLCLGVILTSEIKRKSTKNVKNMALNVLLKITLVYRLRDETLTGSNHNWSIDFRVTSTFQQGTKSINSEFMNNYDLYIIFQKAGALLSPDSQKVL